MFNSESPRFILSNTNAHDENINWTGHISHYWIKRVSEPERHSPATAIASTSIRHSSWPNRFTTTSVLAGGLTVPRIAQRLQIRGVGEIKVELNHVSERGAALFQSRLQVFKDLLDLRAKIAGSN